MKVKVYYNLHKNCYSIVSLEKEDYGRVIKHENCVALFDAQFRVSEKGRQRVLREKTKNVHAYVVGNWLGHLNDEITISGLPIKLATYNPYKYGSFVDAKSKKPLTKASQVLLSIYIQPLMSEGYRKTSHIHYVA